MTSTLQLSSTAYFHLLCSPTPKVAFWGVTWKRGLWDSSRCLAHLLLWWACPQHTGQDEAPSSCQKAYLELQFPCLVNWLLCHKCRRHILFQLAKKLPLLGILLAANLVFFHSSIVHLWWSFIFTPAQLFSNFKCDSNLFSKWPCRNRWAQSCHQALGWPVFAHRTLQWEQFTPAECTNWLVVSW